jgi:phosphoglycolate phosphatase
MSKPVVMFDHDGVLADSLVAFTRSFIWASQSHGHPEIASPSQVVALFNANIYESMLALGMDVDEVTKIVDAASVALAEATDVHLFPGISELLAGLAPQYEIVVVTSNHGDLVQNFLDREHQAHHVTAVLGSEAGASKIEKIRSVIAQHPRQRVFTYVGDTRGDMIESLRAGASPIGAAWGWHSAETLADAGAVHVAPNPADLLRHLLSQADGAPDPR